MRVVPHPAAASAPAPYAAAETAFAEAKAYLSSREARQMSESDLERELHRRGQELMQKLLQGHLDQRSPGRRRVRWRGPTVSSTGNGACTNAPWRRSSGRCRSVAWATLEPVTTACTRWMRRSTCRRERYSLEVRRRVAEAAASRSFDEALFDLSRSTGAEVPKRQAEQLAARAAEDFDAFYEARRAAAGEPSSEESVVVLTFDGKGVVLHREDLREATRRAAERRRRQREQLSPFNRLQPGEKKHAKRMATVAAVYAVAPFVRSADEFLRSLMPRQPGDKTQKAKRAKTAAVRPRPVAKRVWASLEREPAEVTAEAMLEAERHDPERVKRWVVLVDGAETQLDLVEAGAAAYGVEVTVVLDIIHVVEYVWKAAHVFHSEGSPERACWAWTRVRDILEGKARRVAASMRRAATVAGFPDDARKPVDTCANYLLKYAPYLHYDRYLAAGYPIATGVVEGACRHLVRDRMELTGARWRLVGAEAVLKLRALRASGDFDAYWDFHEAREYERNHAQNYADGMAPPVTEPPPQRPPHPVFDGSSSSYRATHRTHGVSLDRRRKRAAPFSIPDPEIGPEGDLTEVRAIDISTGREVWRYSQRAPNAGTTLAPCSAEFLPEAAGRARVSGRDAVFAGWQ